MEPRASRRSAVQPTIGHLNEHRMGRDPPGRASWRCSQRRARGRGLDSASSGGSLSCCASSWPSSQRRATRTGPSQRPERSYFTGDTGVAENQAYGGAACIQCRPALPFQMPQVNTRRSSSRRHLDPRLDIEAAERAASSLAVKRRGSASAASCRAAARRDRAAAHETSGTRGSTPAIATETG